MLEDNITVSELSAADGGFQLLACIRSRRAALRRQSAYCAKVSVRPYTRPEWSRSLLRVDSELNNLECHLVKSSTIDHAVVSEVRNAFQKFGDLSTNVMEVFGVSAGARTTCPDSAVAQMLEEKSAAGRAAAVATHSWRLREEIQFRAGQGWYIVFDTLTVRPADYVKVFGKGSTAVHLYLQGLDRAVGAHIHGSVRKAIVARKASPYHTYFGVVERGAKHGWLHLHFIHCFRDIPDSWKRDPNLGLVVPKRRKISEIEKYWSFGFSAPIAVRFSDHDAFGKLKWVWPMKWVGTRWVPVASKPPLAIAHYLCKYLTKNYNWKNGGNQWRVKRSRSLGLTRIRQSLRKVSCGSMIRSLRLGKLRLTIKTVKVPSQLLRIEMLRQIIQRIRSGRISREPNGLNGLTVLRSLQKVPPRQPLGERLRSSTPRTINSSWRSSGITETQILKSTGVSDVFLALDSVFRNPVERFRAFSGTCHGCV